MLAGSWRIATKRSCRNSQRVVKELIRETVKSFIAMGGKTAVFIFYPRHERIYQRLLKMETVARSSGTKGLKDAPAVFMRMDMDKCPEEWKR
jgi:hypothetical protein